MICSEYELDLYEVPFIFSSYWRRTSLQKLGRSDCTFSLSKRLPDSLPLASTQVQVSPNLAGDVENISIENVYAIQAVKEN